MGEIDILILCVMPVVASVIISICAVKILRNNAKIKELEELRDR